MEEEEGVAEEAGCDKGREPGEEIRASAGDLAESLADAERWERSGARIEAGDGADKGVATSSTTGLKNWTEASVDAASLELVASLEEEAAPWGDMSGASS